METKQKTISKEELRELLLLHTPILVVSPVTGRFTNPFSSGYGYSGVIEGLTENLFEKLNKSEATETIDYKQKYEKCIKVIKRFDAGIIGMYNL